MLQKQIIEFCKALNYKSNLNAIRLFFGSVPHYPSLFAIVKAMNYSGIPAKAGVCDITELLNEKKPVLIHCKKNGHDEIVLARVTPDKKTIKLFNSFIGEWFDTDLSDITACWDGIVIYSEPGAYSKWNHLTLPIAMLILLIVSILSHGYISFLLSLPIFAGCLFATMIYSRKSGVYMPVADHICHINTNLDCDSIINSRYNSIGKYLNLVNLSASYFLSQGFIYILSFNSVCRDIILNLYLVSAIAFIPIAIYSVYSQIKVRKLCTICVCIILTISVQALIAIYNINWKEWNVNFHIFIIWGSVFAAIYTILYMTGYISELKGTNTSIQISLLRHKRNKNTIQAESVPCPPLRNTLNITDYESNTRITTIVSPNCIHCKKMITQLFKIHDLGIRFKWDIILGTTSEKDSLIIKSWINLYYKNKEDFSKFLRSWADNIYESIELTGTENDLTDSMLNYFSLLNKAFNINSYPRIIMNDRLLSTNYSYNDLFYILMDDI